MKFDLMSDLHLEFDISDEVGFKETLDDLFKTEGERPDTLIVAGDICPLLTETDYGGLSTVDKAKLFFDRAKSLYKNVVYVLGNHDYWTGVLETIGDHWEQHVGIRPLINSYVEIEGVVVYGSTFWTKIPKDDCPMVEWSMNDYRYGRSIAPIPKELSEERAAQLRDASFAGIRKLTPYDTSRENATAVKKLKQVAKDYPKVLVVSHHAPLKDCAEFKSYINVAYCNNLKRYLTATPSIVAWCHGHLHGARCFDMECGTHIFANPRGYIGREKSADGWHIKTFEI